MYDLNELSAEELVGLAYQLEDEMEKEAGEDFDLNELSAEQIVDLAYELQDDMEKEASGIDLNELSIDEFIDFASDLEYEMEKEAGFNAQAFAGRVKRGLRKMERKVNQHQFRKGRTSRYEYGRNEAGGSAKNRITPVGKRSPSSPAKKGLSRNQKIGLGGGAALAGGGGAYAYSRRRR